MARRFVCSPTVAILLVFNLVTISLLISNESARNAIVEQLGAAELLELKHTQHNFEADPYLQKPPAPKYFTRTRIVHYPKTVLVTTTATATATVTSTITAVQTIAVPKATPEGLPKYCDECGPDDRLCKQYGQHNLERSRAYEGPNTRLRRVLQKAADGHPINIGVLGGSVTAGHGVVHPEYWTDIFFEWWNATFPHENNVFVNGAIPAITSDYYSLCALEHIDEEVDLVVIEMAINDPRDDHYAINYEWLVRMLLDLPNRPAVVNAQVIALSFDQISMGGDLHTGVAEYYDLPTISLRNVALYHILENPELDRDMFHRLPPFQPESETDLRHTNRVGHKMMADLLIAYMQRQICAQARLKADPSVLEFQPTANTIPGPNEMGEVPRLRMFQKYVREERVPHVRTSCLSAQGKRHPLKPVQQQGWFDWAWKDKAYLVAKEPGSRATFSIVAGPMGVVKVSYLQSKTFGLGSVKCWVDNNEAGAIRIDGWWNQDGLNIARDADIARGVSVGSHEVTCQVLEETADPGGGHEFRLISLTRRHEPMKMRVPGLLARFRPGLVSTSLSFISMLRSPRASLFVTTFCLVYAAITTFIILNGSAHGGWLDKLVPSLGDPPPPSSLEQQHAVILEQDCTPVTVTATRTITTVQTVVPAPPGPGYCHECGADDTMCKEYGQHNLQRSRGFEGSNARLKRILRKAASGQPINIGVLGGSVTHGHGVVHPEYWTDIFFTWWNTTYPNEKNVFVNGAVPATGTDYFSVCAFEHIDQDVDLVIIEMAINDLRNEDAAKSYEWLLRLLLQLPSQPAIINVHVMALFFEYLATGGDYHLAVAQYYDTPVVSLRHVLLNHLLEHNNLVHKFFHAYPPAPQDWPPDLRHINRVGHKMTADLLIAYMQRVTCQIAAEDAHPVEPFVSSNGLLPTIDFMEQVPRLRLFQGYAPDVRVEHVESTCLSMRSKKHPLRPSHTTGWSEWSWKDKSYLVGREPDAVVTFDIHIGPMGVVKLEYLRSKTFGMGMVRCWVGEDNGGGETFDGYWDEPLNIARGGYIIQGYNPGPAQVSCKILDKTSDPSGGHEFRLIALTSH